MRIIIVLCLFIIYCHNQIVLNEDFQSYDLGGGTSLEVNYQGSWYEKSQGINSIYTIKNYDKNGIQTQCLDSVRNSIPYSMCILTTSLQVSAIYKIEFDMVMPGWLLNSGIFIKIEWNQQIIDSFQPANGDISEHYTFFTPTHSDQSSATLCFPVSGGLSYISTGPLLDNITVTFSQYNLSHTPQPQPQLQTQTQSHIQQDHLGPPQEQYQDSKSNNSGKISDEKNKQINQKFQNIGSITNQIINWVSFGGFGYLISNLINFWNLIVLYYFLNLENQPEIYRKTIQNLCIFTMKEGSIFSLLSSIASRQIDVPLPEVEKQLIPQGENGWMYYQEAGLSSNFLNNNYEIYFVLLVSFIKILFIHGLSFLPFNFIKYTLRTMKMRHFCLILLYEIIMNSHILVFPFAILLSPIRLKANSSNFSDKINSVFIILAPILCYFTIIVYAYLQQQGIKIRNQNSIKKDAEINILTQFQKQKIALDQVQSNMKKKQSCKKKNIFHTSESNQSKSMLRSLEELKLSLPPQKKNFRSKKKQAQSSDVYFEVNKNIKLEVMKRQNAANLLSNKKQILFSLLNHQLFIFVPFLIGLQIRQLFFSFLFIYLIIDLYCIYRYGRTLKFHEKIFRILIKVIWLMIHLVYFQFFLRSKEIVDYSQESLENLGLLSIILIIIGALIEFLHTITNLCIFIKSTFQIIFPQSFSNRVGDQSRIQKNIEKTQKHIEMSEDYRQDNKIRNIFNETSFQQENLQSVFKR